MKVEVVDLSDSTAEVVRIMEDALRKAEATVERAAGLVGLATREPERLVEAQVIYARARRRVARLQAAVDRLVDGGRGDLAGEVWRG